MFHKYCCCVALSVYSMTLGKYRAYHKLKLPRYDLLQPCSFYQNIVLLKERAEDFDVISA